jgi:hypothetical protein
MTAAGARTGGARMDHNWTTGEVGGVLAAVLAALGAIGGFVRWALGWGQSQTKLREAKLERWEKRLTDREIEYREKIEAELGQLRTDIARQSAKHARQIAAHHNLSLAFPLDPDIPDDMVAAAREIGDGE